MKLSSLVLVKWSSIIFQHVLLCVDLSMHRLSRNRNWPTNSGLLTVFLSVNLMLLKNAIRVHPLDVLVVRFLKQRLERWAEKATNGSGLHLWSWQHWAKLLRDQADWWPPNLKSNDHFTFQRIKLPSIGRLGKCIYHYQSPKPLTSVLINILFNIQLGSPRLLH